MSLEDLKGKAQELADKAKESLEANKDKVQDALKSDKAEEVSDKVLDGAADIANKVTGGKFADQIAAGRDNLDEKLGK